MSASADVVKSLATAEEKRESPEALPAELGAPACPRSSGDTAAAVAGCSREARASPNDSVKKNYFCDNCGRMFNLRTTLIRHLQLHEYKPYMCHICERLFIKFSALCNHRQVHFKCRICQKPFNLSGRAPAALSVGAELWRYGLTRPAIERAA